MSPSYLNLSEAVFVDTDLLTGLYSNYDETLADSLVCDTLENLAILLARIERQRRSGDLNAVIDTAKTLHGLAMQIGMPQLSTVATSVAACALRGDLPGLGATTARLSRVGDASLSAIWGPQDLSG